MNLRPIGLLLAVAVPSLAAATLAVWALQTYVGVSNASIVYLTAVVATVIASRTPGAMLSAVASLLLYDFFFTEPYHTLTISDPGEWLSVILLLFVGIVVGQLTAVERARTRERARANVKPGRCSR